MDKTVPIGTAARKYGYILSRHAWSRVLLSRERCGLPPTALSNHFSRRHTIRWCWLDGHDPAHSRQRGDRGAGSGAVGAVRRLLSPRSASHGREPAPGVFRDDAVRRRGGRPLRERVAGNPDRRTPPAPAPAAGVGTRWRSPAGDRRRCDAVGRLAGARLRGSAAPAHSLGWVRGLDGAGHGRSGDSEPPAGARPDAIRPRRSPP